jgi:hypothetical protein
LLPKPYPVKRLHLSLLQLIHDWTTPFLIYTGTGLLCCYAVTGIPSAVGWTLTSFVILLLGLTVRELIKWQLGNSLDLPVSTAGAGVLVLLYLENRSGSVSLVFLRSLLSLLVFMMLFCISFNRLIPGESRAYRSKRGAAGFLAASDWIFQKPSTRISLITAAGFKWLLSILIAFIVLHKKMPEGFLGAIYPVLCTPAIYFTYVFNNFSGFHPQLFLYNAYQQPRNASLALLLRATAPLLLTDGIFSIAVLSIGGLSAATVIFLLLSSLHCLMAGYCCSMLAPKKVTKAFDLQNMAFNTSLIGNLLLIGLIFLEWQVKDHPVSVVLTEIVVTCIFIPVLLAIGKKQSSVYQKVLTKIF